MANVYAFVSGRGGTGKSALAAGMSVLLSGKQNVLALDLSVGMRSLDQYLGYADRVVYDVMDISDAKIKSRQVILSEEEGHRPSLIPASQTRDIRELDAERITRLITQLRDRYDTILLDVPAGRTAALTVACRVCDRILITETPDISGIRGIDRMKSLIETEFPNSAAALVLNRYIPGAVAEGWQTSPEEICELTGLPLAGWLPEDTRFASAILTGTTAFSAEYPAVHSLTNLIRCLSGTKITWSNPASLPLPASGNTGFWQRLFRSR